MTQINFSIRTLLALLTLAIVAAICFSLGQWQLDRAAQRQATLERINAGHAMQPLTLGTQTPTQQLTPWRRVQATGQWLHKFTMLLANRNHEGRPGYWVATPFELESGHAVMVLRGWIARPIGAGQTLPELNGAQGIQVIEGELLTHIPRLFELWSFSSADTQSPLEQANWQAGQPPPELQNLTLQDAEQATGLKLLPAVVQQASADRLPDGTPLVQDWAAPQTDADKNRGYALQWFIFALIATGAWLVVAWRAWQRRRKLASPSHFKE
ncbi:MAG TPA: SURF1 family protein [Pusillimonas sp.]|jgi:cytochrome oxidase assembly protein ShyY1|nr:SURF1 family protein [Pusillimonas sp.]|tara:strand:+ start:222747 stop:223553 length:807 start_codon:yes stop_codon:yes gene_type:complete